MKQEIEKIVALNNYIRETSSSSYEVVKENAFIADKTMLDRACEWLKENIDLYTMDTISAKSGYNQIVLTRDFETAFRQAMEGGAE